MRLVATVAAVGLLAAFLVGAQSQLAAATTPIEQQILDGPNERVQDSVVGPDGTRYVVGGFNAWGLKPVKVPRSRLVPPL